jgi:amino acid transporter
MNTITGTSSDGNEPANTFTYTLDDTEGKFLSSWRVFRLVEQRDPRRWSAVRALLAAGTLMVAVLAATVLLLAANDSVLSNPAAALSLVLVAATVVLILVMCTLTIVFRRLRIHDKSQPMGLPRGSVRAVIALLLITLFFIAAIFLFSSTQKRPDPDNVRTLTGISATRPEAIPTDEIKDLNERLVGTETRYDVVLFLPSNSTTTSDDIAKQLVTTVGTLVTAVAAFYFGANTVAGHGGRGGDGTSASGVVVAPGAGGPKPDEAAQPQPQAVPGAAPADVPHQLGRW